jgi:hypothetical protein
MNRYFPELIAPLAAMLSERCVADGEIVIVGVGGLDFETERAKARELVVSCACRFGDAVDAAAFLFGRGEGEPELLLQGAGEDAAHGVALPTRSARHFIDRCPLGASQRRSIAITPSCFDDRLALDCGSGSGKASIAGHS